MTLDEQKKTAATWFRALRDQLCTEFERIEAEYAASTPTACHPGLAPGSNLPEKVTFTRTPWQRPEGGQGEISIMKGRVFEKVGVNISVVEGEFSEQFRAEIPGASENPTFWAAGISLVAHMCSPLVPAAHFNTRMIVVGDPRNVKKASQASTAMNPQSGAQQSPAGDLAEQLKKPTRLWFGGGGDLNPMFENATDTADFHAAFKQACDTLDLASRATKRQEAFWTPSETRSPKGGGQETDVSSHEPAEHSIPSEGFYDAFRKWCDEYFYIPHRNEPRGVGGIFYDYLGLNRFGTDTSPITSGRFGKGGLTKKATLAGMQLAANANLDWNSGFEFTQHVGRAFATIYPSLIRRHMFEPWTDAERHHQLVKRGRYAEYNLLYDRGTRFGLMTGGNPDAILMSLPPVAIWE